MAAISRRRLLALTGFATLAAAASGCDGAGSSGSVASEKAESAEVRAVWDARLVALSREDADAEALAESLEKGNDPDVVGGFTRAEAPGDGTVVVTYTADQAQAALDDLEQKISDAVESFLEAYSGCSLEAGDGFTTLNVRLAEDVALADGFDPAGAASDAILEQYRMVQAQLLANALAESEEPWSLTTRLYDADDGRLIKTYEDVFSLDYESAEWDVAE